VNDTIELLHLMYKHYLNFTMQINIPKNNSLLQLKPAHRCKPYPVEQSLHVEVWSQVIAFQPQVYSPHQGQN